MQCSGPTTSACCTKEWKDRSSNKAPCVLRYKQHLKNTQRMVCFGWLVFVCFWRWSLRVGHLKSCHLNFLSFATSFSWRNGFQPIGFEWFLKHRPLGYFAVTLYIFTHLSCFWWCGVAWPLGKSSLLENWVLRWHLPRAILDSGTVWKHTF